VLNCPAAPLLLTKKGSMNIVITGSIGHIGKPLTQELIKRGHTVTVVSSKAERKVEIEQISFISWKHGKALAASSIKNLIL
jgi:nucleoside-diphosphate-sugar epimerase